MQKKIVASILSALLFTGTGAMSFVRADGSDDESSSVTNSKKGKRKSSGESFEKRKRSEQESTDSDDISSKSDKSDTQSTTPEVDDDADTQPIFEVDDDAPTQPVSLVRKPSTPPLPEPIACEPIEAEAPKKIPVAELKSVCDRVKPLLMMGTHVQEVEGPTMVVGDLHGDYLAAKFYCQKFEEKLASGECKSIVFLGDYVDRGKNSIEVAELLFRLKIKYPDQVYLLRGNHETMAVNRLYGFGKQCIDVYAEHGAEVYSMFNEAFDCLPLTAVIDGKVFCVHGGISPLCQGVYLAIPARLNKIRDLPRGTDCGFILENLLWNDYDPFSHGFNPGDRGNQFSHFFGNDVIDNFLEKNGLEMIVRAHEHNHAIENGGGIVRDNHGKLVTLIGTPDYLYGFDRVSPRNNGYAPIVENGKIIKLVELKHKP